MLNLIGLQNTLKGRLTQDMLITIDRCFQKETPTTIANSFQVKNTNHNQMGLKYASIPKVSCTKHDLRSHRYFAAVRT